MYAQHFQLRELPFGITPDTSYFFASHSSQQALNTLLVAARTGEGFIKITGEVGTGKTMLCRQLLGCLGSEFQVAYVPNPCLTPMGLLMALADELGASTEPLARAARTHHAYLLIQSLNLRLLELAAQGRHVLVCLDEVQAMPIETLETLRLLTNLETEKRKLVQVVIFGQPELDERLNHPSIRQLRQRITFEYRLAPLGRQELAQYLDHRMSVAGYQGAGVFSTPARWLLKWRTRGFPRLVNIVAHKALMCAYGAGRPRVGWREMRRAIADTASLRARVLPRAALAALAALGLGFMVFEWMGAV
ncbi:ExeA family protein [Azohydromonas lata]|uniref:AAA family ATPase n=1 Tax=Azohydromonas lata TaxID=45677 RepID=A0ABU5ID32_9BURK|nr:AAA family ATPase [Azohydromonas lata]MDZ5457030.1 AAA family ATPase [Azohydromonas lata]